MDIMERNYMGEPINLSEQINGEGCLKTLVKTGAFVIGACLFLYSMDVYRENKVKPKEKQESVLERETRLNSNPVPQLIDLNDDGIDDLIIKRDNGYSTYLGKRDGSFNLFESSD